MEAECAHVQADWRGKSGAARSFTYITGYVVRHSHISKHNHMVLLLYLRYVESLLLMAISGTSIQSVEACVLINVF